MNAAQRDELLIRLDERTCNIYTLTEKQERHLSLLNDSVAKNTKHTAVNKNSIFWLRIISGVLCSGLLALILKMLGAY